jgi:serine/threonine-protein kinase RsbW
MRSADDMPGGHETVKPQSLNAEVHHIAELGRVRHDLGLYLDTCCLPAEVTYDLLTCIQEASKNALRFAPTASGVQISVMVERHEVTATVCDRGPGLDLEQLDSLPPDPESEVGRGLFLMHALMDSVEFRVEDGTEVRLRKRLPPPGAAAARAA